MAAHHLPHCPTEPLHTEAHPPTDLQLGLELLDSPERGVHPLVQVLHVLIELGHQPRRVSSRRHADSSVMWGWCRTASAAGPGGCARLNTHLLVHVLQLLAELVFDAVERVLHP